MKDFGLHNALAVLLLIVGGAAIVGFGVLAYRIADTWTPANTNFLTASMGIGCVVSMVVFAFFGGGALWAITGRYGSRGDEPGRARGRSAVPPGFQIVDGTASYRPDAMPLLQESQAVGEGSWDDQSASGDDW